jgi:hypothetical protein
VLYVVDVLALTDVDFDVSYVVVNDVVVEAETLVDLEV